MLLSMENYHSVEARQRFMSASRYKDYAGSLGLRGCEAKAIAMDRGEWEEPPTKAMLMSSYVDQHFGGTLDVFKAQNPEIFTKRGDLRAEFKHAEVIVNRIERDEYFMQFMSGERQKIFTAEIFGIQWSCAIDSYLPGIAIVDLKVMADLNKSHWVRDYGHMSFVTYYGYDIQAAIYQKIIEICTGEMLPFFIAGASKEEHPNIEIIGIDQKSMDNAFAEVERNIQRIKGIRHGINPPDHCGSCDFCRETKILTKPIHYSALY